MIALVALTPVAFLYPLWRRANERHSETRLLLLLPTAGVLLWLGLGSALAAMDIKGASLSNAAFELSVIVVASSIVVIARLRLLDSESKFRPRANALAIGAVALVVVLVRGLVPELGE